MEKASNAANRALARVNAFDERRASSSDDRGAVVWAALADMYGPRLVDDYGDEPPRLWREAISRLSDEQLSRGFENLANDGSQWPPTLPTFVESCRRAAPVRHLGVPLTREQQLKLLPAPHELARPEKIDGYLAKMRARLAS